MEEILGFGWAQDKEQLGCVLSGNYRKPGGEVDIAESFIRRYVEEFALPLTKSIIRAYAEGRVPDHLQLAADFLRA